MAGMVGYMHMKTSTTETLTELLRGAGYRATPGKIALLSLLEAAAHPLTIAEISEQLSDKKDETTLYRSLDAFVQSGIIRRVHFNDRSARYEWNVGAHHHHHIVCEECGKIEDVDTCATDLEKKVLGQSKQFKTIRSHSVEFFGVCAVCEKK
jgi:Fe2+ or Zn2+ uptake regulation protein